MAPRPGGRAIPVSYVTPLLARDQACGRPPSRSRLSSESSCFTPPSPVGTVGQRAKFVSAITREGQPSSCVVRTTHHMRCRPRTCAAATAGTAAASGPGSRRQQPRTPARRRSRVRSTPGPSSGRGATRRSATGSRTRAGATSRSEEGGGRRPRRRSPSKGRPRSGGVSGRRNQSLKSRRRPKTRTGAGPTRRARAGRGGAARPRPRA